VKPAFVVRLNAGILTCPPTGIVALLRGAWWRKLCAVLPALPSPALFLRELAAPENFALPTHRAQITFRGKTQKEAP